MKHPSGLYAPGEQLGKLNLNAGDLVWLAEHKLSIFVKKKARPIGYSDNREPLYAIDYVFVVGDRIVEVEFWEEGRVIQRMSEAVE